MEIKTISGKLYPNNNQSFMLNQFISSNRFAHNYFLGFLIKRYEDNPELSFPRKYDLIKMLPSLKKKYSFLKEYAESSSLQKIVENLYDSFIRFFKKKGGYPKFKSKKRSKKSMTIKQNNNIEIRSNKVKIPKIGWVKAKVNIHIDYTKVKEINITKTNDGCYFIKVVCQIESQDKVNNLDIDNAVGIDWGQTHLAILSDGNKINSFYRPDLDKKIKSLNKSLSRKNKNSSRWKRNRNQITKVNRKNTNAKLDYLHKITTDLIKKYDYIFVEDISASSLRTKKNSKGNNKKISNQSWALVKSLLEYKATEYGKVVIFVDP